MEKITGFVDVFDNGIAFTCERTYEELDRFMNETGAKKWVASRWSYNGNVYETCREVKLLPDGASLIYRTDDCKKLIVLNGDNTVRCEIVPPVLSHDVSKIDASVYRSNKNDPRTARPFLVYPPTPEIAAAILPQKRAGLGWLALPQSLGHDGLCGIHYGCEGNEDGEGEPYIFEFDWNTGALLKAVHMPRTW